MESYELSVNQIFSDKMVLPKGKSFQVGGLGPSGVTVKVELGLQTKRAIVNRNGEWSIRFDPVYDTNHTFLLKISDEKKQINIQDVRFGRVILFAGQSNIGFRMSQDQDLKSETKHFDLENIYYYNAPQPSFVYQDGQVTEYESKDTHWHQLKVTNLGHMSAVAYYAAKEMHQNSDEPLGIVCVTKDGAPISIWLSNNTMCQNKQIQQRIVVPFQQQLDAKNDEEYQTEIKNYRAKVRRHNQRMYRFMKDNPQVPLGMAINVVGQTPWPPPITPDCYLKPGSLFDTMLRKIKYYPFNSVVWYQGETDGKNRDLYATLLADLINDWRALLADYSLPFYIVQLPKFAQVARNVWADIREQQLQVTRMVSNTHLISILDTGELYNPHPVQKKPVGQRVGEIVAGKYYDNTPSLQKLTKQDGKIILEIRHCQKLKSRPVCFIEALVNNQWQSVPAQIKLNTIEVQTPLCATQLRYAYSNVPTLTLFNEVGYPVSGFKVKI